VRRPEFRALKVVRGRYRSPHARGAPFGWARTASNSHLLGAWPTPADQGGPSGDSAGLTGLSETKRVRHRRPARTELAPSRAVPHRRDNAPRRTPVSTRVTGTGPFTLRLAKRCGLKRVVCYPCYAFKVCVGLAEWGRGRARTRPCLRRPRRSCRRWRRICWLLAVWRPRRTRCSPRRRHRPRRPRLRRSRPSLVIIYNTMSPLPTRHTGARDRNPAQPQGRVHSNVLCGVELAALARSDSLTDDHLKSHVLPDSPAQDVCQQ
jgi:hypothetical protein